MQRLTQKQIGEKLHMAGAKMERIRHSLIRQKSANNAAPAPRSLMERTFSGTTSISQSARNFVRCYRRGGFPVPAGEVLIKRALTPPKRRMTLRWLNFRATPSRLSNMSMA